MIVTGVILGNISDSIENMNEEETKFERELDEMQIKLKQNKIPEDIQEKIQVFMQYCHQEGVEYNKQNDSFDYMAKVLRKEFLLNEYENLQNNVPMFVSLNKDELFSIFAKFK